MEAEVQLHPFFNSEEDGGVLGMSRLWGNRNRLVELQGWSGRFGD
jgi:hypothetical protein